MRCLDSRFSCVGLMLFVLGYAPPAAALLGTVTATPPSVTAAMNRSASFSVSWRVALSRAGNVPDPVGSSGGQFTLPGGGAVLGVTVKSFNAVIAVPGGSATFSEVVTVPRGVLFAAVKQGADRIEYRRTFTDPDNSLTGVVTIALTGSGGGAFGIERLSLHFDDLSPVRLVRQTDSLTAQAEISFAGTGLLQAVWEIADPSSTFGEPVFRPLRTVRRPLMGGQETMLESPPLPTEQVGVHLVRFRVTEPETAFEPLVIRYFVMEPGRAGVRAPEPIVLQAPVHGATLEADTEFAWLPVEGASAYQIELFRGAPATAADLLPDLGAAPGGEETAKVSGPPAAGLLVAGDRHRTALSALVREHLESGTVYWWSVIAIGADGSVVGESPLRKVRVP